MIPEPKRKTGVCAVCGYGRALVYVDFWCLTGCCQTCFDIPGNPYSTEGGVQAEFDRRHASRLALSEELRTEGEL